jgi:hypothetical protein
MHAAGPHLPVCSPSRHFTTLAEYNRSPVSAGRSYAAVPAHSNVGDVLSHIAKLERYVNELGVTPATAFYRSKVILALLSKALTVGRAVCHLVVGDFPAEAFGLSRTLADIFFCVRYISNKNTEERAATYADYRAKVHAVWLEIIQKYYPNSVVSFPAHHTKALQLAATYPSKHQWTGHGGQARLMALEENIHEVNEQGEPERSEFDYDVIYFWTSQFVHATVVAVEGHASKPGEAFRTWARRSEEKGLGDDALFNVLIFLSKIFVSGCRGIREAQPETILRSMQKSMKSYRRHQTKP